MEGAPPMPRAVGIDLGTTNSAIAILDGDTASIVANAEGGRTTPSVVAFTADNETLVGEVARRQAVLNPARTYSSVKRHIGTDWTSDVNGSTYTPQEISARILQKLKNDAEAYLNEEVSDAVITVPAYFNDAQRQATVEAGRIAGLNVLRIINEPTAAAVAYGLARSKSDEIILVFDLGGGTFDVSLLEVGKDEDFSTIQVKATAGDNELGGDDWDAKVVDWLRGRIGDVELDASAEQRLFDAAEQAKKDLSQAMTTTISLQYLTTSDDGPVHVEQTLSRAEFEEITEDLLNRTREPFQKALDDAGLNVDGINHVVLVGGSTRMPAVTELVKELTGGREPNKGVNPDEVVASGAALQTGVLNNKRTDLLLVDVTPLSLGLETTGGVMTTLIEKNTAIPTQASQVFTTAEDDQDSVEVKVFQGERRFTADNLALGTFELKGIPAAPRGVPKIEVTFSLDANGIVNVSARDTGSGKEQKVTLTEGNKLPESEIQRMVRDAESHEKEDEERRKFAQLRNKCEDLIYRTKRTLNGSGEKLSDKTRQAVERDIAELEGQLDWGGADELEKAYAALSLSQQTAGEEIYNNEGSSK